MISLIMPVLNESEINFSISVIRQQKYQNYEIIVVDGDPDGSTLKLIHDKEIRKVCSQPGRSQQMNFGAQRARGDILLFLHADSFLPDNAFQRIEETIESGYMGGAFDVWFDSSNWLLREVISRTSSLRSRLTRLPYGDQGHFFRADFFRSLGGYAPVSLMEDIEIMQQIKKRKEKIFILSDRIKTSARRWEEEGTFYVMVRNPIISSLYLLGISADKLAKFYPNKKKNRRKK